MVRKGCFALNEYFGVSEFRYCCNKLFLSLAFAMPEEPVVVVAQQQIKGRGKLSVKFLDLNEHTVIFLD